MKTLVLLQFLQFFLRYFVPRIQPEGVLKLFPCSCEIVSAFVLAPQPRVRGRWRWKAAPFRRCSCILAEQILGLFRLFLLEHESRCTVKFRPRIARRNSLSCFRHSNQALRLSALRSIVADVVNQLGRFWPAFERFGELLIRNGKIPFLPAAIPGGVMA